MPALIKSMWARSDQETNHVGPNCGEAWRYRGVVGDKVALLETLHSDITAGNVILRPGTCQAQAD